MSKTAASYTAEQNKATKASGSCEEEDGDSGKPLVAINKATSAKQLDRNQVAGDMPPP